MLITFPVGLLGSLRVINGRLINVPLGCQTRCRKLPVSLDWQVVTARGESLRVCGTSGRPLESGMNN